MATKRIKSQHPESQGPFVVIEADDFDPEKHEEYFTDDEAEAKKADAKKVAGKK